MKTKKRPEADLEELRLPLLFLGFLIGVSVITLSFSYKTEADYLRIDRGVQLSDIPEEFVFNEEAPEQPVQPITLPIEPPIDVPIIDQNSISTANRDTTPIIRAPIIPVIIHPTPTAPPVAPIIDIPDVEASFPGGISEMYSFLKIKLIYPDFSQRMGDQGKVFMQFVVNKDGSIEQISVLRGVSRELDAEAVRVIKAMPNWKPAQVQGENVRTYVRIPITFILRD